MRYLLILIVLLAGCRQTVEETFVVTEVVEVINVPDALNVEELEPSPEPEQIFEVKRFESVEAYFKDGNPNPLSHRKGLPNFKRRVSDNKKDKVKERDGGCCLVCSSRKQLEVDHRIALMNGGDNSMENLGTLCDDCHNEKTRYDWSIQKRRKKQTPRK